MLIGAGQANRAIAERLIISELKPLVTSFIVMVETPVADQKIFNDGSPIIFKRCFNFIHSRVDQRKVEKQEQIAVAFWGRMLPDINTSAKCVKSILPVDIVIVLQSRKPLGFAKTPRADQKDKVGPALRAGRINTL